MKRMLTVLAATTIGLAVAGCDRNDNNPSGHNNATGAASDVGAASKTRSAENTPDNVAAHQAQQAAARTSESDLAGSNNASSSTAPTTATSTGAGTSGTSSPATAVPNSTTGIPPTTPTNR